MISTYCVQRVGDLDLQCVQRVGDLDLQCVQRVDLVLHCVHQRVEFGLRWFLNANVSVIIGAQNWF